MLSLLYTPAFIRSLGKLPSALQEEALEKIELFRNTRNHSSLRAHKLTGRLQGRYSFSVNYRYRIIFTYEKKSIAILHTIGDHSIYE